MEVSDIATPSTHADSKQAINANVPRPGRLVQHHTRPLQPYIQPRNERTNKQASKQTNEQTNEQMNEDKKVVSL